MSDYNSFLELLRELKGSFYSGQSLLVKKEKVRVFAYDGHNIPKNNSRKGGIYYCSS